MPLISDCLRRKGNDDFIEIIVALVKDNYALVMSSLDIKEAKSSTQVALMTCVQENNNLRL